MKKEFFRKFFLPALVILAAMSFIVFSRFPQKDIDIPQGQIEKTIPLSIGQKYIRALVARTEAEQEQGLGDRDSLPSDEGMLFIFTNPSPIGIWMKDMRFPLDILWVDETRHVLFIKEDALPSSYPEIFAPDVASKYVIEVSAGFVKENNIKIGAEISFSESVLN